jgi:hypothetical protein
MMNFLSFGSVFSFSFGWFTPPGSGSAFWMQIRIRIQEANQMRIQYRSGSETLLNLIFSLFLGGGADFSVIEGGLDGNGRWCSENCISPGLEDDLQQYEYIKTKKNLFWQTEDKCLITNKRAFYQCWGSGPFSWIRIQKFWPVRIWLPKGAYYQSVNDIFSHQHFQYFSFSANHEKNFRTFGHTA